MENIPSRARDALRRSIDRTSVSRHSRFQTFCKQSQPNAELSRFAGSEHKISLHSIQTAAMAALRPEAPAPQNAADDSDGGSLRRLLPRAAWDCLAAYVASPEFAMVMPTVSKTFCRILDGAPAWAHAWAALSARRSTHLAFATCKPWNYREDRPCTRAERKAIGEEVIKAQRAHERLYDNFNVDAFAAAEKAGRAKEQRKLKENNWFGMPAAEPRVAMSVWSFLGPGVREEAARSNALSERPSPQPRHQDEDHDDEESEEERVFADSGSGSDSDSESSDTSDSGDDSESDAAEPQASNQSGDVVHPRVLLATSQEAQYFRRLRGALEAWAGRLPAAKGAAVRDFATRASPGVFITAEGEAKDIDDCSGNKQISIATISVTDVLVRVVVVPQCWCHYGEEFSQLSQSFTCGFRRPGKQWVLPINYECEDRTFSKCNRNRSSVARGDLLLDMARAVGLEALEVPDLVHLLFLVGGTHPVIGHIMYGPYIFSDWIECVDAARRGELKSESEGEDAAPETIAWGHWHEKTRQKRPDLSTFGSLLVFGETYHGGPGQYTYSLQYGETHDDGRDEPVRLRIRLDRLAEERVRMRKNRN